MQDILLAIVLFGVILILLNWWLLPLPINDQSIKSTPPKRRPSDKAIAISSNGSTPESALEPALMKPEPLDSELVSSELLEQASINEPSTDNAPVDPAASSQPQQVDTAIIDLTETIPEIPETLNGNDTSPKMALLRLGPEGSFISGTDFDIRAPETIPQARIQTLTIYSGWVIDNLQVQYGDIDHPSSTYQSAMKQDSGDHCSVFKIPVGDYLSVVKGTWGRQAEDYSQEESMTLQFQTHLGLESPVYGELSGHQPVQTFSLAAPMGYEIVGFFGAYGSHHNALIRIGIWLTPMMVSADSMAPNMFA